MTFDDLLNLVNDALDGVTDKELEELELVIEDMPGNEYVVDKVYFFEPFGIGIDIKRRFP